MWPRRKSASNVSLGSPARGPDGTPPQSHHQRKPSVSSKANGGGITPSLARTEMNIILPTMQHRCDTEASGRVLRGHGGHSAGTTRLI